MSEYNIRFGNFGNAFKRVTIEPPIEKAQELAILGSLDQDTAGAVRSIAGDSVYLIKPCGPPGRRRPPYSELSFSNEPFARQGMTLEDIAGRIAGVLEDNGHIAHVLVGGPSQPG